MVKFIEVIKRKNGMTQEEFRRHWKEVHGPLVLKHLPGVVKYVQNHPVKVSAGEPAYDGVAEVWFKDLDAFRAVSSFYRSEAGRVIRDDELRFIDTKTAINLVVEEVVMK